MYNLIVDAGNSSIKLFLFQNGEIVKFGKVREISLLKSSLEELVSMSEIDKCIVSSVSFDCEQIIAMLDPSFPVMKLDSSLRLPIINKYKTPESLGSDRIAAVVGAVGRYPGRNILVIDSGTAITYDIVTDKAEYLGGNISVGLKSRFRALNNFTGKLPLLQVDKSADGLFGTTTAEAMTLGVQNGIVHEVEGTIRAFGDRFENLLVVFTGGDSFFFENRIRFSSFAEPNLVAIGLNEILEYNV